MTFGRVLAIVALYAALGTFWGAASSIVVTYGDIGGIVMGGPLGMLAGLGVSVFGVFFIYKKDLGDVTSALVAVVTPITLIATLPMFLRWPWWLIPTMGVPVLACLVTTIVLRWALRDFPTAQQGMYCSNCNYDLQGSINSVRCPECGAILLWSKPSAS